MPELNHRPDLIAPGVLPQPSARDRAVAHARQIVAMYGGCDDDLTNLARQYLRILGLPEKL